VFTTAGHLFISCSAPDVFSPLNPTLFLQYVLIIHSQLRLAVLLDLFTSVFPTKFLYAYLLHPMRATCLARPILLISIALITLVQHEISSSLQKVYLISFLLVSFLMEEAGSSRTPINNPRPAENMYVARIIFGHA
jgi:phosphoglycerol transferase MdoB-like AlkP superfamily enzyme